MFGTLNTRLWSDQPGYVDSNTQKRNPHATAELTIAQLEEKLREFIAQYHNEIHSRLNNRSPLMYWQENCFAEEKDARELDPLLMKAKMCKVNKAGIQYQTRLYWHRALGDFVGKRVSVRSAPNYAVPDDIEVFDGKKWICTAFAIDSAAGKAITAKDVKDAQHDQRQNARQRIHEARNTVTQVDAEIAALQVDIQVKLETSSAQELEQELPTDTQPSEENQAEGEIKLPQAPDLFDVLEAHYHRGQA